MSTRSQFAGLAALCLVLFSACAFTTPAAPASSVPATESAAAPAGTPAAADAATLTLSVVETSLGSILVDGKGMTLYMFTKDSANSSACTGPCLTAWPPLIGEPTAGTGVDDSKLGSFARADGSTQASYNGWPLYYWQEDTQPGDVKGQNVNAVWFVLDRDGDPIKS